MLQRGLTHAQLGQLATDDVSVLKLRDRVTACRIDAYFERHRADFDAAHVAASSAPMPRRALLLHRQIVAGEVEFFAAAQRPFLRVADPASITPTAVTSMARPASFEVRVRRRL